ncbi:MAG: hypothetical protein KKG59_05965 [Nanoarchaeota archaeon]|nr:hypothetical protein [Nanoarchaeota archaeon]
MKRLLILLALLLTACSQTIPVENAQIISRIDAATESGLLYLAANYNEYQYNDEYLTFVYGGESLECPLPTPCNVTYRLLDAYFDVYFLEEVTDTTLIQNQVDDAHAILSSLAKKWEAETIYNTKKSQVQGGIALDTYCILGFLENNHNMAEVVKSYVDVADWMEPNAFQTDIWRNVADESWCARLFIKTDIDKQLTKAVIYRLVDDTTAFKNHPDISDMDKLSVIYHMLYVLEDWERKYDDTTFKQEKLGYSDFISYFSQKNLQGNSLMTGNLLDVMVYSNYDNPETMKELTIKVLGNQRPEGHWRMTAEAGDNYVQVFTTFRALIGLNQYKQYLLK